jgi:hypothetical protein
MPILWRLPQRKVLPKGKRDGAIIEFSWNLYFENQ